MKIFKIIILAFLLALPASAYGVDFNDWIPTLTENATPSDDDVFVMVDNPAGTPVTKNISYGTFIGLLDARYIPLTLSGVICSDGSTPAACSNLSDVAYEPVDATILRQADVDDTPVNGADTVPVSSNWAYDHAADPDAHYAASASPTDTYLDSDAPGADKEIAKIVGAYIDGADGSENGTLGLYVHVAGTTTSYIQLDGKNTKIDISAAVDLGANNLSTTGLISGAMPSSTDADGKNLTAAEQYGYTHWATGAGTWNMAGAAAGMNFCIYSTTAAAVVLNPDDGDTIVLNGTALAAGDSITSASGAGDFICLLAKDANTWYTFGRSGTWTDTN